MIRNSASVRVADLVRANASPPVFTSICLDSAVFKRSTNLLVARRDARVARPSGRPFCDCKLLILGRGESERKVHKCSFRNVLARKHRRG